ncbi:MAG: HAMP domain-containing protein, partial [Marinobacter sp.]|uniref:HAMP domain-containing protein n=1 Tax=Marinobacter sp. TaxID=50741 RepID=UPI00299E2EF2
MLLTIIIATTAGLALQGYADRSLVVADASMVKSYVLDARTDEKNFVISQESQYIGRAKELVNSAFERTISLKGALKIPEDQQRLAVIRDSLNAYDKLLDKLALSLDQPSEVLAGIEAELAAKGRLAADTADELQDVQMERMAKDYSSAMNTIVVAAATVVVLATLLGWLLTRSITRPINEVVEVSGKVASGDLSVTIHSDRGDEFGKLLAAFDTMVTNLRGLVKEIGNGA